MPETASPPRSNLPLLVAVVGLRRCFEGQSGAFLALVQPTHVAGRIEDCPERTASAGKSLRVDSPSDRCPVGRPCRPAGRGIGLELDHLLGHSRSGAETVERRVGNVLLDLVVLDRVPGHPLDHSRCVLAPPAACVGFLPPSCVASIPCGFP